jgi:hypothetical protein
MKKTKPAHRPPGAINKKNAHGRDERAAGFRCSQGFVKVVDMLLLYGQYRSKADIYHEALQLMAMKKNIATEHYDYWVKKIQ